MIGRRAGRRRRALEHVAYCLESRHHSIEAAGPQLQEIVDTYSVLGVAYDRR
mgnify:CR=1 FL=1